MPQTSTIDKVFQRSTIPLTLSDASSDTRELTMVNAGFCAMTGYEREQCIGRNCRFLQGDDRDQAARYELQEALRSQRDTEVVLRNYTRSGAAFDNLLFVHHIRDVHSRVVYVLGSQFALGRRTGPENLNLHVRQLDAGLASLAESHHAIHLRVKRQLSNTASTMLHSAVLHDRLARLSGT